MVRAAQDAGELVLSYFNKVEKVSYKDVDQSPVSKADTESQELIQKRIIDGLAREGISKNEVGFIGEENNLQTKGKYLFVVDPLDGTTNFVNGIAQFGITIACFVKNELTCGVIYIPNSKTTYCAAAGGGAWRIDQTGDRTKLTIKYKKLGESILAAYIHSKASTRPKEIEILLKITPHIRTTRMIGAHVIDVTNLLENRIQLIVLAYARIWDIAAAVLLVSEAGGFYGDLNGRKIEFDFENKNRVYEVLACHPKNLEKITRLLRPPAGGLGSDV